MVVAGNSFAQSPDFSRDIRPILAERCLKCHGRDEPQAELNLTTRDGALAPAASGQAAIVPGQPDESQLVRRITAEDAAERMPPEGEKPLTADEIARLTDWVAHGATWGEHWAFTPLVKTSPPSVGDESWVHNDIDRFVLAKLDQLGAPPSPAADREHLIKRLYYDLWGLPPTPEEIDAFAADASPDAYRRLVDRLLDSRHFGERWGRHWLDLAHYADSDGYEKDRARPDAYLFRDWVIDAIHRDVPFDQFTIAQLAGDLLPGATAEDRLATAFLRQTLTNEEGGVDQEEFRVNACFDRTDTVGTVWLGLTVGCAKCHSHKYDPLSHADYYRLFAYFNDADEDWTSLPIEARDKQALLAELAPLEAELSERHRQLAPAAAEWEAAERAKFLAAPSAPRAEHALKIVQVDRLQAADSQPQIEGDGVWFPLPPEWPAPDRQTLTVTAELTAPLRLTGLKLVAVPDERLPGKGPGRAANGNFVVSGLKLGVVADGAQQVLALHRAEADYAQPGFAAAKAVASESDAKGWAVGGKLGAEHWLQTRTREAVPLPAGARLLVTVEQNYGQRHTLGRFRLLAISGDEPGLHVDDADIVRALRMYPEKRVAKTRQDLFDYYVRNVANDGRCRELERRIKEVLKQGGASVTPVRTVGRARLPRATYVLHRGDFLAPTDPVAAATPGLLPAIAARGDTPDRLDLARWLVSPANPLTARVAVNHIWQHLFGQPLVTTANDFGLRGDPPSQPELLDWLAETFRSDLSWRRKELIRLIVSSAVYQQSSQRRDDLAQRDPGNRWLARQGRFRVEAEIVRDLSLSVSGLLSPKVGGPSVFPPMPEDLAKLSYANSFTWTNSTGDDRHRRGMYTFLKRTILHPNLTTFDAPDANGACTARTASNTPLQALLLLNNESHVEATRALGRSLAQLSPERLSAVRLTADGASQGLSTESMRLAYGMRLCVARPPRVAEVNELTVLLAQSREFYAGHLDMAAQLAGTAPDGEAPAATADEAAWIVVARVLLNLDEFLTRE